MEEYKSLRDEIKQSIFLQYQVLAIGGTTLSVVTSLALKVNIEMLIGLPLIAIILLSLWTIEQNRMMKAGDYLELLEDKFNQKVLQNKGNDIKWTDLCLYWENSLRIERPILKRPQYLAQIIGILGSFLLIDAIGIYGIFHHGLLEGHLLTAVEFAYLGLSVLSFGLAVSVIRHKDQSLTDLKNSINKYAKKIKK